MTEIVLAYGQAFRHVDGVYRVGQRMSVNRGVRKGRAKERALTGAVGDWTFASESHVQTISAELERERCKVALGEGGISKGEHSGLSKRN
jgi:hypothetical protein